MYKLNIIIVFLLLAGCGQMEPKATGPLAGPITAKTGFDDFSYEQYKNLADSEGSIADIFLRYDNSGRDFDNDGQADGYAVILTPISKDYDAMPIEGQIIIRLYRIMSQGMLEQVVDRPLLSWEIGDGQLKGSWRATNMLDGYVLRLSWGDNAMANGRYLLLAEVIYQDKGRSRRVFREIRFDESSGY